MPIYKMDGKKDGLQKYRVRINFTDSSGKAKQIERVAYGKDEAKQLEQKLNMELRSGEITTHRMTVRQLYEEFIKVKSGETRESSLNTTKKQLNTYVLPHFDNTRIDKLSPQLLQKWKIKIDAYKTRGGDGLAIITKQSIYTKFSNMLKYAVKMEYIPKNPLTAVGNFKDAYTGKKRWITIHRKNLKNLFLWH